MLTHQCLQPKDPSRVVVIGSGGFIGKTLVRNFQRSGIKTLGLTRDDIDLNGQQACDLLVEIITPTDAVVFLAALTPGKGRGISIFLENLRMGANICEALAKVKPAHVVYFSSDAVYPMESALINEHSCAQPDDLYGMMHLARELMLKSVASFPVAVLRPSLVYGTEDTHNSYGPNRFRRMAQKEGKIFLFGEGEEKRDHILVSDVAEITLLALQRCSFGTLNVATGQSISFVDLANKVATLFDKPIQIVSTTRVNIVRHRHFDVSALHEGFQKFAFTPLDVGLAKVHQEMLEH